MKRMRIPATTANMGPGFDCIGMAFDMYNYIDFERKVFVQNVARVDLGSFTWEYSESGSRPFIRFRTLSVCNYL